MKLNITLSPSLERLLFGVNDELREAVRNLRTELMATKQELLDAVAVLGTRVDEWLATQTGQTSEQVQKLLDDQKAKLAAEDATMDAADFDEIIAGVMAVVNRIPPKFDPSANG